MESGDVPLSQAEETLEDWWNEGFDDFFSGAESIEHPDDPTEKDWWLDGWYAGLKYRMSIERTQL